MEEVIKYFEALEARIAANEALIADNEARIAATMERIAAFESRLAALEQSQEGNEAVIASLEAELDELKNSEEGKPSVVRSQKSEASIQHSVVSIQKAEPEPEPVKEEPSDISRQPSVEEPEVEPVKEVPVKEEVASPKAAVYGKAVDDIRLAISLGDRFLYQRELFGQNAELMQRTLAEMNDLNSFDEAIKYIGRFNWDTESKTYQQFLVTLHRRFG